MVLKSRRDYLEAVRARYRKGSKKAKALILNEFCATCGYHRKYAIRLLGKKTPKKPSSRRPGPRPVYQTEALLLPLKRLWFATDQMCSKKLRVAIGLWLPFYEGEYGALDDAVKEKLCRISPSTIDRLLRPLRAQYKRRGICGTKPGTLLKNQIPIKTHSWDVTKPGFFEADTVAHCGNSLSGDFVWSLTFTDIATGWTENRAVWNKGSHGILAQIKDFEETLPFPVLGFDCDNGSEFLNYNLLTYFTGRQKTSVHFTRSRPYMKNDNAHVEQKNWSHVRQLLGYERFDRPQLVDLLNDLYKNEYRLYNNFFCPTLKLKEKQRINSKYHKRYETPQTPYQRLTESEHLTPEAKETLANTCKTLNPFTLKKIIEAKLKTIFNTLRLPHE